MADVNESLAKQLDLPVDAGALVQSVTDGQPRRRRRACSAGDTGQDGQIAPAAT